MMILRTQILGHRHTIVERSLTSPGTTVYRIPSTRPLTGKCGGLGKFLRQATSTAKVTANDNYPADTHPIVGSVVHWPQGKWRPSCVLYYYKYHGVLERSHTNASIQIQCVIMAALPRRTRSVAALVQFAVVLWLATASCCLCRLLPPCGHVPTPTPPSSSPPPPTLPPPPPPTLTPPAPAGTPPGESRLLLNDYLACVRCISNSIESANHRGLILFHLQLLLRTTIITLRLRFVVVSLSSVVSRRSAGLEAAAPAGTSRASRDSRRSFHHHLRATASLIVILRVSACDGR